MVRRALAQQGLRTPVELDVTGRIRQELGADVAPCTVMYVDDPILLLEAVVFNRGAALLIPQPLVVTGNGRESEVLFQSPEQPAGLMLESAREPLLGLRRRMVKAIEGVAGDPTTAQEKEGAGLAQLSPAGQKSRG